MNQECRKTSEIRAKRVSKNKNATMEKYKELNQNEERRDKATEQTK
jgi:hypothetical protein